MRLVTISGLPGSGTSTLCRALEAETKWVYLNTGQVFRELAEEAGLSLQVYGRQAEADAAIDRQLDARMVQLACQAEQGCVLEGRLMGWMAQRRQLVALKVWLHADIEIRTQRVSAREDQTREQAMAAILEREESERLRYATHHDIDLADMSIYDLVLDSDQTNANRLCNQVLMALGQG
jgi:cytidylate kinase